MTLREVLQIEIWSKRTTRKIWFGIGLIAVAIVTCYLVSRFWISPMERSAGREALASIENLQAGNDAQFDILYKLAKDKIDTAERKSLTLRDQQVSLGLKIYLSEVWLEKQKQIRRNSSDERMRKIDLPEDPKVAQLLQQVQDQVGQTLHRVLD